MQVIYDCLPFHKHELHIKLKGNYEVLCPTINTSAVKLNSREESSA